MKLYKRENTLSKIGAFLLSMVLLLGSSLPMYASSAEGESGSTNSNQEVVEYGFDPEYTIVEADMTVTNSFLRTMKSVTWVLKPGTITRTGEMYVTAGGYFGVGATLANNPNGYPMYIGISDPTDLNRYVMICSAVAHNFAITKTGNYSFYAKNPTTITITLYATYSY